MLHHNRELPFLQGGGEMGQLLRSLNWSDNPLGDPVSWPAALKQTVSMMLTTAFPVLICWGENYIQLYNDAFRPINGATKHPQAMSGSAKDTYAEIWDQIGPMFKSVMQGQTIGFPNFMVPLDRNGYLEDCYFDFSYSPIRDENGRIGGVLVICMETTEKVKAIKNLEVQQENIRSMVRQAPVGMCIVKGSPLMVEEVNDLFLEIIGKEREIFKTVPYWVVNAEVAAYYEPIIDEVLATGETYHANEHEITLIRKGRPETVFVDFVFEPIKDVTGNADAIIIVAIDVSDKVTARKKIEESADELQAINEEITAVNEELTSANEELGATIEELAAVNEELATTNDELTQTQVSLQRSEKLFRSIAANIPNSLIVVIDKDHRYKMVDGDIMEKMGYNRKDYEGKHPSEISLERYEASKHLFEKLMAGEQFSVERKGPGGESYLVHFVPLKNDHDEVDAGMIILFDISDIKLAEEKSAKLAAIIESSDDAIIGKTLESVITSWNNGAERMFGYTANEIIGETIYKLIPPDRVEEEPRILSRLKNGERVEHFETKRLTREGKLLDVSLTISPIKDPQGNIIGLSKIARDITERKRDETRKNDFIAMVSHELKTPLTSLTAIVQLAHSRLKKSDDAFLIEAMDKANIQVKKMSKMINGFLNVSRLESGKIFIDKSVFNLADLIGEVIKETELTVSSHTIKFETCPPVMVNADHDKIGSVIINLISNAVKYSPRGKLITVKCNVVEQAAIISVADEGMGIKSADIGKIFDRYYRVETKHTQHISGFGIGLYLSAEIIRRHDGKVWVESESGKGSTFFFSLPRSG